MALEHSSFSYEHMELAAYELLARAPSAPATTPSSTSPPHRGPREGGGRPPRRQLRRGGGGLPAREGRRRPSNRTSSPTCAMPTRSKQTPNRRRRDHGVDGPPEQSRQGELGARHRECGDYEHADPASALLSHSNEQLVASAVGLERAASCAVASLSLQCGKQRPRPSVARGPGPSALLTYVGPLVRAAVTESNAQVAPAATGTAGHAEDAALALVHRVAAPPVLLASCWRKPVGLLQHVTLTVSESSGRPFLKIPLGFG